MHKNINNECFYVVLIFFQVYIIGDYDQVSFMDLECHNLYHGDLPKTKFLLKRGICSEKFLEKLPSFHD